MTATGSVLAGYTLKHNIDEPLAMLRSMTSSYYEADGLGSGVSLPRLIYARIYEGQLRWALIRDGGIIVVEPEAIGAFE